MQANEIGTEVVTVATAAKAAPPLAVSVMAIAGVTLSDWVYVFTLIYLGLQIFFIIWEKVVRPKFFPGRDRLAKLGRSKAAKDE